MESIIYCDEITTSSNADNVLIAIARANCQNHADTVDFNKYSVKDNIGLVPVSDIFCDCFILQLKDKNEDNQFAQLRNFLNTNYLPKAGIICIGDAKYKIACPDYDAAVVIEFLKSLTKTNYELNCIDITQDFAGSFDKKEVTSHLMDNHGFVVKDFISKSRPTILKNNNSLPTCLQFYKTKNLRCKIYLKMVEMLRRRSVRKDVGNRWFEWACKEVGRIPKSRDASTYSGLTRIEVTYYNDDQTFEYDMEILSSYITNIGKLLNKEIIYSTPHHAMWHAYCECFKQTLIVTN